MSYLSDFESSQVDTKTYGWACLYSVISGEKLHVPFVCYTEGYIITDTFIKYIIFGLAAKYALSEENINTIWYRNIPWFTMRFSSEGSKI